MSTIAPWTFTPLSDCRPIVASAATHSRHRSCFRVLYVPAGSIRPFDGLLLKMYCSGHMTIIFSTMNLQAVVPTSLWTAVAQAYEAKNYSHAILEATYCLSNILREKAGVDGDGAALVGAALGGENPKLKLNQLLTESERNVQKGYEQIVRGIYIGIRNPRSHETVEDTKATADSIIHFVGHIMVVLNASKEAFSVESFIERVLDSDFVETERYAELLVAEIPNLRIGDALMSLFQQRRKLDLRKLRFLISAMIGALSPTQLNGYLSAVGEEFRTVAEAIGIRSAIQMLKPEIWQSVPELPRLRIENRMLSEIKSGKIMEKGKTEGALGTWSNSFLKHFTMRNEASLALIAGLEDFEDEARHYIATYFLRHMPDVITLPAQKTRAIRAIADAITMWEDTNVRKALVSHISSFPNDWQAELGDMLIDLVDEENPAAYLFDGRPFLSSPANDFSDDVPF